MKKLLFGPGLLEPTFDGRKRITIRRYRQEAHDFQEGEYVLGVFDEGVTLLLRITNPTEVYVFSKVPEAHACMDGFEDRNDLFNGLKTYYADLKWSDEAGVIQFEPVIVDEEYLEVVPFELG